MFGSAISHVGHNCYTLVSSAGIDFICWKKRVDTGGTIHPTVLKYVFGFANLIGLKEHTTARTGAF